MADINFSEDQYKNSNQAVDLNAVESKIETAINDSQKNGNNAPSGPGAGGDDMLAEASMVKAGVAGAAVTGASIFISDMNNTSTLSMSGNKARSASMFIGSNGKSIQQVTGGRPTNAMGMKMTYSEAKDAHKKQQREAYKASKKSGGKQAGLVSSANIAGESLSGECGGHKNSFGTKGAFIDAKSAVSLGLVPQQYKDALTSVKKAQHEAPSIGNLEDGLKKGHSSAEQFVASNPNNMVVQNLVRRYEGGGPNH